MKRNLIFIRIVLGGLATSVLMLGLGLFTWDLINDRFYTVKVLRPTPLYQDWESDRSSTRGSVIRDERLKVVRIRYAKDHMAIRVEKTDGTVGWIIVDDAVQVFK